MTMRRRTIVLTVVVAAVVVAGIAAALRTLSDAAATLSDEQRALLEWSGPVRRDRGEMVVQPMTEREDTTLSWADRRDAPIGWVDITRLGLAPDGQTHWNIELAGWPPPAAGLDRAQLIAYGLVLETTGDSAADYVVGINNDAPVPGDFRVWVTDLATGETEEQIGAPYGFPVEFSHPDERRADGPPGPPTMTFTFLPGSGPPDLNARSMRFYAWASTTDSGDVVAWDYAPDAAWLLAAPSPEQ